MIRPRFSPREKIYIILGVRDRSRSWYTFSLHLSHITREEEGVWESVTLS